MSRSSCTTATNSTLSSPRRTSPILRHIGPAPAMRTGVLSSGTWRKGALRPSPLGHRFTLARRRPPWFKQRRSSLGTRSRQPPEHPSTLSRFTPTTDHDGQSGSLSLETDRHFGGRIDARIPGTGVRLLGRRRGDLSWTTRLQSSTTDIDRLAGAGIWRGCPATQRPFLSGRSVTRAEIAAFLHRASGE